MRNDRPVLAGSFLWDDQDLYGGSSFGLRGFLGSPSGGHRPTISDEARRVGTRAGPSIVAGSGWAAQRRPLAMQLQVAIQGVHSNRLRKWCAADGRWKFASFRWYAAMSRLPFISSACRWAAAGVRRWAAEGRPLTIQFQVAISRCPLID